MRFAEKTVFGKIIFCVEKTEFFRFGLFFGREKYDILKR